MTKNPAIIRIILLVILFQFPLFFYSCSPDRDKEKPHSRRQATGECEYLYNAWPGFKLEIDFSEGEIDLFVGGKEYELYEEKSFTGYCPPKPRMTKSGHEYEIKIWNGRIIEIDPTERGIDLERPGFPEINLYGGRHPISSLKAIMKRVPLKKPARKTSVKKTSGYKVRQNQVVKTRSSTVKSSTSSAVKKKTVTRSTKTTSKTSSRKTVKKK